MQPEGYQEAIETPPQRRAAPNKYARNGVSNGTRLLQDVDGRLPWVRRAKDLINEHIADLGGEENTSAAERALIRRAAILIVELERMEQKFALNGEASDKALDIYQRMTGALRRVLETTGLKRRARDVSPPQSLTEIAKEYVETGFQNPVNGDEPIDANSD